jgi:hypothetical protein
MIRPGLLDRRLLEGIVHRTDALAATAIRETLVLRSDWLVRWPQGSMVSICSTYDFFAVKY